MLCEVSGSHGSNATSQAQVVHCAFINTTASKRIANIISSPASTPRDHLCCLSLECCAWLQKLSTSVHGYRTFKSCAWLQRLQTCVHSRSDFDPEEDLDKLGHNSSINLNEA